MVISKHEKAERVVLSNLLETDRVENRFEHTGKE
jgi:hypothetical protein